MNKEQHLCDYGCGQEALYQFKNGRWCCSKNHQQCPNTKSGNGLSGKEHPLYGKKHSKETRKKISEGNKGKIISQETKEKMSISHLGEKNHFYGKTHTLENRIKISKFNKGKKHSIETRKKISKGNKGKYVTSETRKKQSISAKGYKHTIKTKLKLSIKNKISIEQIKERYPTFSKVEEMRYEPGKEKEKIIQVHCKNHNCPNSKEKSGWFTPSGGQIGHRIDAIERYNDGNYMYCSEECKEECPLYGKRITQLIKEDQIRAGIIKKELYTDSEYQIFRQHVLKRESYLCEYCESKATHVHHSRPQKLEPGFVLDPDFGVACCESCHYKYGHKTGTECSTGNLASTVCR